jgi:hypothetical protein
MKIPQITSRKFILFARMASALGLLFAATFVSSVPAPMLSSARISRYQRRHAPAIIRERHGRNATSTNWSGYAVTAAGGSVTYAKGSWIVPPLTCPHGAPDTFSSFWVGIDGYESNTVEQTGIDANCVNGAPEYSAWFEFYPHFAYVVNNFTVKAGDTISAEVSYGAKGQFTVTLQNGTQSFSTSTKMPQAKLSSAEWIVEAPWGTGVEPLANFGVAEFGQNHTRVSQTCYATIGGTKGAIGSFDAANVILIDMVTNAGALKAQTSPLSKDGSSFTVSFVSSGP